MPSRRVHDLCRHIVSGIHCQAGATPHQERVWPSQALASSPSQRDRPALQPSAGSLPPEALAHPSQKFGRGVAPAQLRCRGYASWKVCANSADVHSQRRGASGDQSSHDARARRASHRKQAALQAHSRGRVRVGSSLHRSGDAGSDTVCVEIAMPPNQIRLQDGLLLKFTRNLSARTMTVQQSRTGEACGAPRWPCLARTGGVE